MATEFQFFPGLDYTLLRREDKWEHHTESSECI
jgi:hypothetical protein